MSISRSLLVLLGAGLVHTGTGSSAQTPEFDVLIRGGQVLDGTGAAAVARTSASGRSHRCGRPAREPVGAPHASTPAGSSSRRGSSISTRIRRCRCWPTARRRAKCARASRSTSWARARRWRRAMGCRDRSGGDGVRPDWTTFTGYFERLERQGISINVISHVASRAGAARREGLRRAPGDAAGAGAHARARRAIDGGGRLGARDALRERRPRAPAGDSRDGAGRRVVRRQLHLAHRQRRLRADQGARLRHSRRRGSEDSRPHLPLQGPRARRTGAASAASSSSSRTRARAG